jgi:hypothetical protein
LDGEKEAVMSGWPAHLPRLLTGSVPLAMARPAQAATEAATGASLAMPLFMAFVVLVAAGLGRYAWQLRQDYVRLIVTAPHEPGAPDRLAMFRDSPFGLPEGSVRGLLALLIVLLGLPALVLSGALGLGSTGEIGTILGGVLGFYFGARSAGGETSRVSAPAAPPPGPLATTAAVVREVAGDTPMGARVASALETAQAASGTIDAVRTAIAQPTSAHLATALTEAAQFLDPRSAPGGGLQPALAALGAAMRLPALAGALGAATPAGLAAGVLLGAWQAARQGRDHYARWMARILDRPVPPELMPLGAWDGEAARAVIGAEPALAAALADRLDPAAPQDAAAEALARLLGPDGAAWLDAAAPGAFADPASRDAALALLRRRVLDAVLDAVDAAPLALADGTPLPQARLRADIDRLRAAGVGPAIDQLAQLADALAQDGARPA